MNAFLRFKGLKLIFSIFVKRKNLSFICGEYRAWKVRRNNSYWLIYRVFMGFLGSLRNSFRISKKQQKNGFYMSKFLCSMFATDKIHDFSFYKNWTNVFKPFNWQKPIHFIRFLKRYAQIMTVQLSNKASHEFF